MKVYIITGAGHIPGIGSCSALQLLDNGNKVVINSNNFDQEWEKLKTVYPNSIETVGGDITDARIQDLVIETALKFGRIDGIVHNAALRHSAADPTREDWNREFLINVVAPYELVMKASEYLKENDGAVVSIGSRSGLRPNKSTSIAYGTTKAALHHLTKELAVRLSPNVRVNAISPGLVESARLQEKFKHSEEFKTNVLANFSKASLLNRSVDVMDAANTVIHFLTTTSITGQVLPVDCGSSL